MAKRRPLLIVKNTKRHGRGVFAGELIRKRTIIEVCPVIVLSQKEYRTISQTSLDHYVFVWGPEEKEVAIALGYGSLYNHSADANARYTHRPKTKSIVFWAVRDIRKGEEIRTNYHGEPTSNESIAGWL